VRARWKKLTDVLFVGIVLVGARVAPAQPRITVPLSGVGNQYSEQIGVGWGIGRQHAGGYWFFNNGGPGPAPPFGGFDPNSQARFGWSGRSGDVRWSFGVVAGQGSSQTLGSQSPSMVLPNGGMGFFWNGVQQPFVTGILPVVGAGQWISPIRERLWRLQNEQALEQNAEKASVKSSDIPDSAPRIPKPRHDDPPLILKGN
jgi:hypothetical protein